VERGWYGLKESNTVWYDPEKISIPRMERALREAGTYRGTIKKNH